MFSIASEKATAASFDCSRARLPVERMICADALLSDLDEKLYAAFQAADGASSPEIMAAQARWLQQRNRCAAPTCVSALYKARIAELSQSTGAAQAEPGAVVTAPTSSPTLSNQQPASTTLKRNVLVPSRNAIYLRQADTMVGLVQKTPKEVRSLRFFQNYDNGLRSYFQFMTPDQQASYSKILDDWWASAMKEILARGISLDDITILQGIAANFPPEREAQLRQLAAKGLSAGPGPALTNSDGSLADGGNLIEPADRTVWEGTAPCVPKNVTYDFVVLGPIEKMNSAYVMWQGDQRTVVRYEAKYDPTIGTLDISNMQIVQANDFVSLPKSANLDVGGGGATVSMHLSPSCLVSLQKKTFPETLLHAVEQAKSDPTYVPEQGLPFCLSMLAWAHQIQAGAPQIDFSKPLPSDPNTRLFIASAFHDSMAEKFLGRSLRTFDTHQYGDQQMWFKWSNLTDECLTQPLFFDDTTVLLKVIQPFMHQLGNKADDLAIIPTIENRVAQVAQAQGNFGLSIDGFSKLRTYISPLEAELAPALKQVRLNVLKPLINREAQIAIAVVRAESPEQHGKPSPIDRILIFADMLEALKSADQTADVRSAEAAATMIVDQNVADIIALDRGNAQYDGADIYSLARLKQWKDGIEKQLKSFSDFSSYKTAMQSVSEQIDAASPQVAGGLAAVVFQAKDVGEITKISNAVAELQSDHPDVMTSSMWQAYLRGLDQWFAAHTTDAAEVAAPSATNSHPNMASVFHSPQLKNGRLVGAIFDHDFLALRNDQADAFAAIVWMIKPMNETCSGILSEGLMRAVLQRGLGPGIFGNSEDVQNVGAEMLLREGQLIKQALDSPGQFMSGMISDAAAQDRAEADGELVAGVSCGDPDMKTFLTNAQDFLNDPTSGIATDKLGVADVCKRALSANEPTVAPYCACAGPILERRLTPVEAAYLKSDPRSNFSSVVNLLPSVNQELRKCQQ
ncbi:MAG: hypothetical protein KGI75_11305 [Rhizobiaceae bacterium]|nr:hypothetical protein [Rhizobiaceae bacterium]